LSIASAIFDASGAAERRADLETKVERAQKQQVTETLRQDLADTVCVVITHQTGLTVAEVTQLRRQMRNAGARYRVTKNRLVKRALEGTQFESLTPLFTGPTAIAFSRDPVAAAKVVVEFANRNNKLTIVGGALAGQQIDAAGVRELASLPSLDALRAKLVGLLQTPGTRLAVVLQATAGQIARVLAAHAEQRAGAA
jgi:large subunit ribosomal protein L10